MIVFVDESGLSERPTLVRTWAPKGQTPVVQYRFTWKPLSVIAGVTFCNFYFRLYPGPIRARQCVDFLKALRRQIRRKPLSGTICRSTGAASCAATSTPARATSRSSSCRPMHRS